MQSVGGDKTFCLTTSGHVAGIVNPPKNRKYSYHFGGDILHGADKFVKTSIETSGSWWPEWMKWCLTRHSPLDAEDTKIPETKYASFKAICEAPGSYVKVSL